MDSSKFSVKFFLQDGASLDEAAVVPVMHGWIQGQQIPGHLLIDVADYAHVKEGPGVVLVAHEGIWSTDAAGGRHGLMYQRRAPIEGDLAARVRTVVRAALEAARLLEQAPALGGSVKFRTDNPLIRVHDRLLAPNNDATFEAVRPGVEAALGAVYGGAVTVSRVAGGEETLFGVEARAPGAATVEALLARA